MEYAATFHNAEDNVTGLVYASRGAYAAALRDDDTDSIVGCISIGLTLDAAKAKAAGFANVEVA